MKASLLLCIALAFASPTPVWAQVDEHPIDLLPEDPPDAEKRERILSGAFRGLAIGSLVAVGVAFGTDPDRPGLFNTNPGLAFGVLACTGATIGILLSAPPRKPKPRPWAGL